MQKIASDDTRHAQCSRDLDRRLGTRLDDEGKARIGATRRRAPTKLLAGLRSEREDGRHTQAELLSTAITRRLRERSQRQHRA